jgi:2-oxoglutarate dehydrogenase E2 component (dihydrolipoamide succinyltransferase)
MWDHPLMRWWAALHATAGDTVQEDDVVAQIETDKVTIDVKFTGKSGKITSLAVAEGDTVVVGQKVAEFEEGDFGGGGSSKAAAPEPEPEPAAPAPAAAPPPPKQQPAAPAAATQPPPPKPQAPPAPKVGSLVNVLLWVAWSSMAQRQGERMERSWGKAQAGAALLSVTASFVGAKSQPAP